MDGRDQPDTNVVRIRRRGDPSEAERRRLASTIFAEQDDVGTFSHGNLVPPATNPPTEPANDPRATADPYFEKLQQPGGGREGSGTTAQSDLETIAYFDPLTNESAAEMASRVDAPAIEAAMPGSAQLPAELAQPARRRARTQPGRRQSGRATSATRLVRLAVLAALAAALAGGAAFAAILIGREQPSPETLSTQTPGSSEPATLAALQSAFSAIQRGASAGAIVDQHANVQHEATRASTRAPRVQPHQSRRSVNTTTDLALTADRTTSPAPQTTAPTSTSAAEGVTTRGIAQEAQQASSSPAASDQGATPPAGPSGLGQVVGTNCDPKCK
jgi:hypothetical protein